MQYLRRGLVNALVQLGLPLEVQGKTQAHQGAKANAIPQEVSSKEKRYSLKPYSQAALPLV